MNQVTTRLQEPAAVGRGEAPPGVEPGLFAAPDAAAIDQRPRIGRVAVRAVRSRRQHQQVAAPGDAAGRAQRQVLVPAAAPGPLRKHDRGLAAQHPESFPGLHEAPAEVPGDRQGVPLDASGRGGHGHDAGRGLDDRGPRVVEAADTTEGNVGQAAGTRHAATDHLQHPVRQVPWHGLRLLLARQQARPDQRRVVAGHVREVIALDPAAGQRSQQPAVLDQGKPAAQRVDLPDVATGSQCPGREPSQGVEAHPVRQRLQQARGPARHQQQDGPVRSHLGRHLQRGAARRQARGIRHRMPARHQPHAQIGRQPRVHAVVPRHDQHPLDPRAEGIQHAERHRGRGLSRRDHPGVMEIVSTVERGTHARTAVDRGEPGLEQGEQEVPPWIPACGHGRRRRQRARTTREAWGSSRRRALTSSARSRISRPR